MSTMETPAARWSCHLHLPPPHQVISPPPDATRQPGHREGSETVLSALTAYFLGTLHAPCNHTPFRSLSLCHSPWCGVEVAARDSLAISPRSNLRHGSSPKIRTELDDMPRQVGHESPTIRGAPSLGDTPLLQMQPTKCQPASTSRMCCRPRHEE